MGAVLCLLNTKYIYISCYLLVLMYILKYITEIYINMMTTPHYFQLSNCVIIIDVPY